MDNKRSIKYKRYALEKWLWLNFFLRSVSVPTPKCLLRCEPPYPLDTRPTKAFHRTGWTMDPQGLSFLVVDSGQTLTFGVWFQGDLQLKGRRVCFHDQRRWGRSVCQDKRRQHEPPREAVSCASWAVMIIQAQNQSTIIVNYCPFFPTGCTSGKCKAPFLARTTPNCPWIYSPLQIISLHTEPKKDRIKQRKTHTHSGFWRWDEDGQCYLANPRVELTVSSSIFLRDKCAPFVLSCLYDFLSTFYVLDKCEKRPLKMTIQCLRLQSFE